MNDNKNLMNTADTCPATGFQKASICVPVSVKPFAQTGTTKTKCCGKPIVETGKKTCNGTKNGECTFTITQNICVEVPVEFGAIAEVGDTYVECQEASVDETTCSECSKKTMNINIKADK